MTVKHLDASKVREQWRDVVDEVAMHTSEIVVNRSGKPMVAVVSYMHWQAYRRQLVDDVAAARSRMDAGDFITLEQAQAQLKNDGLLP